MLNSQKIAANSSFFLLSLVAQKVLSFVYFTLLARALGAELTGRYFFAISFATMFAVLMDFGLSPVLTKEVAQNKDEQAVYFQQIFSLKLIFTILSLLFLAGLNYFFWGNDPVQLLIYLTMLTVAIDSFTLLFYAYIRGQQNLRYESIGTIIFQIIVMVFGLGVLKFSHNLFLLLIVLFAASLFNFLFSAFILRFKFQTKIKFLWHKDLLKKILLIAWPFAVAAIFAKVYAYLDSILLKIFLGDLSLGFYSVAYKITFAWQFIPLGLVAALYPAFAHYFKEDKIMLAKVFNRGFLYLSLIAWPLSFGIIALAPEIILKVYKPEFQSAILPLQILIVSLGFLFMNFALSSLLNAANFQKINTRNLGFTMVFNIILNLVLIPLVGVWGAALASSLSTLFLFILNLMTARKIVIIDREIVNKMFLAFILSLFMVIIVYYLKTLIFWPLTILVGGAFYLFGLWLFKILTFSDIKYLKISLLNKG